jgi:hypothetical protein
LYCETRLVTEKVSNLVKNNPLYILAVLVGVAPQQCLKTAVVCKISMNDENREDE